MQAGVLTLSIMFLLVSHAIVTTVTIDNVINVPSTRIPET